MFSSTCVAEVVTPFCTLRFLGEGSPQTTRTDIIVNRLMQRYKATVAVFHIQVADVQLCEAPDKEVKGSLEQALDALLVNEKVVERYGHLTHRPESTSGIRRQRLFQSLMKVKAKQQ